MSKLYKGFLSGALVCFMSLTTFAGISSLDNISTVFAKNEDSKELKLVKKKLDHLTYSLKNNYLGIKNQGQWERYIEETRDAIDEVPRKEGVKARELSVELDRAQELVNAVARINQVEKSMEKNFHGIKNANQWSEYLDLARKSLIRVDQKVYRGPYDSLQLRKETCQREVDNVIDNFNKDYKEAQKKYDDANFSMNIEDAKKALKAAENLGNCEKSDSLEVRCKELIRRIETGDIEINNLEVESGTFDDNTRNQALSIKVNYKVTDIDYLKKIGYKVEFKATSLDGTNADIFYNGYNTSSTGVLSDDIKTGVYKVDVTLTKDSVKTTSEKTTIVIKDLNPEKNEITDYTIYNFGADTKNAGSLDNDCFVQNSNTVVKGEHFNISDIKYKTGDTTTSVTPGASSSSSGILGSLISGTGATGFTVSSYDTNIVDVLSGGKELIAKSVGTTRIKIEYKGATRDVTITVSDQGRKISRVKPITTAITAHTGDTVIINTKALDQYGDPIEAKAGVSTEPIGAVLPNEIKAVASSEFNKGEITITPKSDGTLGAKGNQGELQWSVTPTVIKNGKILFNKDTVTIGEMYISIK